MPSFLETWYPVALTGTYIISRASFARLVPNLHHIHDILFSISISYSAYLDVRSWASSGISVAYVDGETHVTVLMYKLRLPLVYTSCVLYKLIWERAYLPNYEKLKYNVGLALSAMYVLADMPPWTLCLLIYNAHGHVHVLDPFLKWLQAENTIQPYTYLRLRALLHNWLLLPICMTQMFAGISYSVTTNFSSPGIEFWLFLGYIFYILFETYVAVLDYGYNRALLRIQEGRAEV
jgi:hypothetical protein